MIYQLRECCIGPGAASPRVRATGCALLIAVCSSISLAAPDDVPEIRNVTRTAGIVYGKVGDEPLLMDLYVPEKASQESPVPWLIRFSSGIEKPDGVGLALLERGYALAYASYLTKSQRAPSPPFPQLPEAPKQAVRFLRANANQYHLDPVKMGVWGWSRGGAAAHWLAHTGWTRRFDRGENSDQSSRVGFCISLAGTVGAADYDLAGRDLVTWDTGEGRALSGNAKFDVTKRRATAPYSYITPLSAPVFWLKGANDGNNVDPMIALATLKMAGVPTKWHLHEGGGHGVASAAILAPMIVSWVDQRMEEIPADLLTKKVDLPALAEALAKAGLITQARMVLEEPGTNFSDELRRTVDRRETEILLEQLEQLQSVQAPRVATTATLQRLAALRPDHPGMKARFDAATGVDAELAAEEKRAVSRLGLMARLARLQREDGLVAAEAALVAAKADNADTNDLQARLRVPWPAGLSVPPWAGSHGMDCFGPWSILRVGEGERAVVQLFRYCGPAESALGAKPDGWGQIEGDSQSRKVVIKTGFWIADTEVSQKLYSAISGANPSHFNTDPNLPGEKVNFAAALAFIAKLNDTVGDLHARLPTLDEWEYACRAGSTDVYAGTGGLDQMGWFLGNSGFTTHPVASKLPNAWGLYDMHGNVWEWCGDERTTPPKHFRTYRGGSFVSSAERCRATAVGAANMDNTTYYHGVRLVIPERAPTSQPSR